MAIRDALNRDGVKFEFATAAVIGLVAIAGIVVFLFYGRMRGLSVFTFDVYRTLNGNFALHVLILTGVMFIG